jgi:hypothetical protein
MQRAGLIALGFLLSAPPGAAEEPSSSPSVVVAPAAGPVVLDGFLGEPAWTLAKTTAGLTRRGSAPC